MDRPMHLALSMEESPDLPDDPRERFRGYGVMGLPFASGHVLAFRRMVASSLGPGYTAVWHRDPGSRWTMYVDVDPRRACPRYFGRALDRVVEGPIELEWQDPQSLSLRIPRARFEWGLRLGSDSGTRAMNAMGRLLPSWLLRNQVVLTALGLVAGRALGLGRLALQGRVPNGQAFVANPRILWRVEASAAVLDGEELGGAAPLRQQARLGEFWIPNRGIFAFGEAFFEPLDPLRHSRAVARQAWEPSPSGAGADRWSRLPQARRGLSPTGHLSQIMRSET